MSNDEENISIIRVIEAHAAPLRIAIGALAAQSPDVARLLREFDEEVQLRLAAGGESGPGEAWRNLFESQALQLRARIAP
jgi:hypothetical protein